MYSHWLAMSVVDEGTLSIGQKGTSAQLRYLEMSVKQTAK